MALGHHPETSPDEKLSFKVTKMGWAGIHGKSNQKDFYREKGGMADKARIIKFVEDWKKYLFTFYIVAEQVIQWGKKIPYMSLITHINTWLQVVLRRIPWRLENQEKNS